MRLLLIRHGETAWNATRRFQGASDQPLNRCGREQAERLAYGLAGETVQACYSSDLRRARDTARIVAGALGLQVQTDSRWREMAFGAWEGLNFAEIGERDPVLLAAWQADPLYVAPPQGETLTRVTQRVRDALADLRRDHEPHTVLLVSHGGPLRVLLCLLLGLAPQQHWYFALQPGALCDVRVDRRGAMLMRFDDRPWPGRSML